MRARLTDISKQTGIPVSTIHDTLKNRYEGTITAMTSLIDFGKLGYNTRALVTLCVDKKDRDAIKALLENSPFVNNLFKINNGYDFMVEVIFSQLIELENFIENLEDQFKIKQKQVYHIIKDIRREGFLT